MGASLSDASAVREGLAVFVLLLAASWVLLHDQVPLPDVWRPLGVACLWLYFPLVLAPRRGLPSEDLGLTLKHSRGWWKPTLVAVVLLLPFAAAFGLWMTRIQGRPFTPGWPEAGLLLLSNHLLLAALPEEVFFRGYLMARFRSLPPEEPPAWMPVTGANLAVSTLFMATHLVLRGEAHPMTLGVFFPSLLFGLLRERTGSLAVPIGYHALCNLWLRILQGPV